MPPPYMIIIPKRKRKINTIFKMYYILKEKVILNKKGLTKRKKSVILNVES